MLIAVDTLRADHVGREFAGRSLTPAMDALRHGGSSFTSVTAPAPWTLPSFTSALTGLMPSLHGAGMNGPLRNMAHEAPRRLPETVPTLARHLGRCGYRTAAFHANPFVEFGLAESFQEHHYRNHGSADMVHLALDWIRRHADRPFFCFLLFNDPHEPTLPVPRFYEPLLKSLAAGAWSAVDLRALARWGGTAKVPHLGRVVPPLGEEAMSALAAKKALYAASIAGVDESVGAVTAKLKDWRLDETTLVTLISDHGEEFLDHLDEALLWDHDPRDLRAIGHGQSLFQELLDVPWLMNGPGVPAATTINDPVSLCDVAPTLTDIMRLDPFPMDKAPLPALTGEVQNLDVREGAPSRILLAENIAYGPDLVAVRRDHWKLIAHRDGRALALYDLVADPGEHHDCSRDHPEESAALAGIVNRWRTGTARENGDGNGWGSTDEKILKRLRELGYA